MNVVMGYILRFESAVMYKWNKQLDYHYYLHLIVQARMHTDTHTRFDLSF